MISAFINGLFAAITIVASSLGTFLGNDQSYKTKDIDDSTTLRDVYRVGVYDHDGFISKQKTINNETEYIGYAADLFNSIQNSSNLKFEFVTGSHQECMDMLENGQIDIYPGVIYSDERAQKYLFSNEIGNLSGVLFTLPENKNLYQDDFDSYNGLKIGMISNFKINESFKDFADKNGFTYTSHYYDYINDGLAAMHSGEIDCFFTDNTFRINQYKILHTFETHPYYNIINKNLTYFRDVFNATLNKIISVSPDFLYSLFDKYYSTSIFGSNISLTREEQNYIDSRKENPVRVAYRQANAPLESQKNDGTISGITKALLDYVSNVTGLKYEYTAVPNTTDLYSVSGSELFASYTLSIANLSKLGLKTTTPIFKDSIVRVTKPNAIKKENEVIAIPSFANDEAFDSIKQNHTYKEFDSVQECFRAVKNGEVDSTYLKETVANYWLKNIVYANFDHNIVSDSLYSDYRFATTSSTSPLLIRIIEKAIKGLTSAEIYEIQSNYTKDRFVYTLIDKLQYDQTFQYYLIISVFFIAAITVGVTSYISIKRNYISTSFVENTKMYNRQNFYKVSQQMIKGSKKTFIFALMQIDRYQVLHATFGDEEIRKYMYEMMKYIEKRYHRKNDFKYGLTDNDTFGFCFEYTPDNMDDFAFASKELSKELSSNLGGFHIGFYIIKDNSQSPIFFYDYAKLALEKAQNNQSKNVIFAYYDESIIQQIQVSNYYLSELPRALKEHEFIIYLQPKVEIATGIINGAEALVRWNHPLEGIISPGKFVPIFEQNGTIVDIDKYVWEATCEFISKNRNELKESVPISVNLSRSDVYSFGIFTYILDLIKKYNITPNELSFEITESLYAENPQLINNLINRLHSYNFKVSMDDFGSAYSSLNMLKSFLVDDLKIYLTFLRDTEWNNIDKDNEILRAEYIIKSVVTMANDLKMDCICEGVETKEQLEIVKRTNCKNAQGFFYSKPVPTNTFLELLKKGSLDGKK